MIYVKINSAGRVSAWQRTGRGLGADAIPIEDGAVLLAKERPCNHYKVKNGRLVLDPPAEAAVEPDPIEKRLDEIELGLMEIAQMIGGAL